MPCFIRGVLTCLLLGLSAQLFASTSAAISGTITDSFGAVIQNAKISLIESGSLKTAQMATTDAKGHYSFLITNQGRFYVRAEADSFQTATSQQRFADPTHSAEINLTLFPSVVAQEIVVTATGVSTPETQTGASISMIDEASLATRRDVEQELRMQPGAQVSRAGQPGAQASLNVRGGPSSGNKVLIDGIPANDIGGGFDFASLSAAGYEKVELYRGPNSALYGSDAESSVVSLTTRRGVTRLPEITVSGAGGTFGTYQQNSSIGGAWKRLDYFGSGSRYYTQNSTPNSKFHNNTYLANIGLQILPGTELRGTARRSVSSVNSPSAFDFYGIPDDGVSREQDTAFGITLENRASTRWHNVVRYAGLRMRSQYQNFGPTGICYDAYSPDTTCNAGSFYPVYLGRPMTIRGANGYEVTGQGILQYGPGAYGTSTLSDRDSIYAQSDFRVNSKLTGLFGFRYESEGGYTNYGYEKLTTTRGNYSYIMQVNGGLWNRLYYTAGAGLENNSVFGFASTPRASLAYYLLKSRDSNILDGTRLVFNFGKGVKEPSIYQETNSLYRLLQLLPEGQQIITQKGIRPFKAETSRTFDGGVQQTLLHGKARVSFTYFHNEFDNQAEFVPFQGLAALEVEQSVINAMRSFTGAYLSGAIVNTLAYRAQGTELEAEYHITPKLTVRGGWTHVDAVVQRSFSSSALNPIINPLIPGVPIGAYSPLVGARPFRVAPNTGYFSIDWSSRLFTARLTGSLVSRRDDSTFLSDANYGYSMLLPNRDLAPSYQKLDLYGSWHVTKRVNAFATLENLLNQRYYEAFGYPALPFTIRSGMQFRFGGESWKLN